MRNWVAMPVDKYVSEKIQDRREQKKITRSKMAQYLNLSDKKIQQIESGKCPICASLIYKITMILGCPVADLFPENNVFKDTLQTRQQKIADFRAFSDELIQNYLIMGPDDG